VAPWAVQAVLAPELALGRKPAARLEQATIDLVLSMAVHNALWGAERIRGELLKLGIRVSRRTIQKYMKRARPPGKSGQTWKTFLENHAGRGAGSWRASSRLPKGCVGADERCSQDALR
jgi:hypothetical protein